MCVRVIPCACLFKFANVFIYGEGCMCVESKAFLCDLNHMRTRGKECVSQVGGVHM